MQYLLFICCKEGWSLYAFEYSASAVVLFVRVFLLFYLSFITDFDCDSWNYRDRALREINAHFRLRSFLISYFQTWHCIFTAAGVHCLLSLSRFQIEIDLPNHEPWARGRTLSDAKELSVCHIVTWSLVDCLFILQKTLWCDAEGEMLVLCYV